MIVYVIDGKSCVSIFDQNHLNIDGHTVSSPEDAIIMLDSITEYNEFNVIAKMNENPEDERDITYFYGKFPNNCSILLVIDELSSINGSCFI
ncbi:hypothetical protein ICE98_00007 [Lactococcus lactis]|nr:hypothetical protein [Lactococcus lactis]